MIRINREPIKIARTEVSNKRVLGSGTAANGCPKTILICVLVIPVNPFPVSRIKANPDPDRLYVVQGPGLQCRTVPVTVPGVSTKNSSPGSTPALGSVSEPVNRKSAELVR